jgi:hypothetical protein
MANRLSYACSELADYWTSAGSREAHFGFEITLVT